MFTLPTSRPTMPRPSLPVWMANSNSATTKTFIAWQARILGVANVLNHLANIMIKHVSHNIKSGLSITLANNVVRNETLSEFLKRARALKHQRLDAGTRARAAAAAATTTAPSERRLNSNRHTERRLKEVCTSAEREIPAAKRACFKRGKPGHQQRARGR
jgi:hypothetical protein